jgi:hypothetical protein
MSAVLAVSIDALWGNSLLIIYSAFTVSIDAVRNNKTR